MEGLSATDAVGSFTLPAIFDPERRADGLLGKHPISGLQIPARSFRLLTSQGPPSLGVSSASRELLALSR